MAKKPLLMTGGLHEWPCIVATPHACLLLFVLAFALDSRVPRQSPLFFFCFNGVRLLCNECESMG